MGSFGVAKGEKPVEHGGLQTAVDLSDLEMLASRPQV
jgi:hypothetical protein